MLTSRLSSNLSTRLVQWSGLALSLGVAACATANIDEASPDATQSVDAAALPALGVVAKTPAVIAAAAENPGARTEPKLILGNDRVTGPGQVSEPITGPATSFKFEDAPASEVVHVLLRDILKMDYVIHPPISGSITLSTRGKISVDKALLLLESALQVNGIVMARDSRGTYHVGKPEMLRGIVSAPRIAGRGPLAPGYGAVIFPLQYLGAAEMASILQPMVPGDAIIRVDTVRNILVMQGTRAQAEGWTDIINTFDVNLMRGMSVGVFPLKYISAQEIEAAIRIMVGGGGAAGGSATGSSAPASGTQTSRPSGAAGSAQASSALGSLADKNNPLYGALRIMPIERLNAVLVVTPRRAYLEEVRYWIEQFDRPNLNSVEPQLFVYKVKNGSAQHLAELLNGIFGGNPSQPGATTATGATGVAPTLASAAGITGGVGGSGVFGSSMNSGFGASSGGSYGSSIGGSGYGSSIGGVGGIGSSLNGRFNTQQGTNQAAAAGGSNITSTTIGNSVRVMADRINNTLLVHAKPAEYERIESTLKRLDVQRAQVLIEASIVEVTLGDGLQYGLQWAFNNNLGAGRAGSGMVNNGVTSVAMPTGATQYNLNAISAAGSGFTYSISNAAGNITAVLSALASKSLIKVISSPSLLVLDNHMATMAVGTQQPVNIGTTLSTSGSIVTTNNIQYKDTGVMLGVKPSVNAGDLVTLDINQMVTDVGPTDTITGQSTFLQRQINSQVAVRSGETLVLGGLIKDNTSQSRSGLPILSSIPVIGGLFGAQNKSNNRTELLVVFTPRVLRSDEDARAVSRELRDRMRGLSIQSPVR